MPSKNILLSKTFWGAVVTAVALLFPALWTKLGITDNAALVDHVVGAAGTALTIWGRFAAGGVHIV